MSAFGSICNGCSYRLCDDLGNGDDDDEDCDVEDAAHDALGDLMHGDRLW